MKMNVLLMMKYEIKKTLGKPGGKVALLALALVLVVSCGFCLNVSYVNDKGETEKGPAAIAQLKAAQKEWAGYLDEAKLKAVVNENARINAEYYGDEKDYASDSSSVDSQQGEIAFSKKQGFEPIRDLLNKSFAGDFQSYDYYTADSLKPEQMKDFYTNRVELVKQYLYENDEVQRNKLYSDEEKAFFVQKYEEIQTPYYYDYFKGWQRLCEYAPTMIIMFMLIISCLVAGIFPEEFKRRSDAVFFASLHGRGRAVAAKVMAGFVIITVLYWLSIGIFAAVTLIGLGADGGSCPVQILSGLWKSFYNITIAQTGLLILAGGYLGCLLVGLLAMLFSSLSRSAVVAGILPFVVFFAPSVLESIFPNSASLALLPHMLFDCSGILRSFVVFSFGGHMTGALQPILAIYAVLAVVLLPVMYLEYRRKQIA